MLSTDRTTVSDEDLKIAQDNYIDAEGISNDYLNGIYPGRETVAPDGIEQPDIRYISSKDGDFDKFSTPGEALRIDYSTGIPTLLSMEMESGGFITRSSSSTIYFRPEGWTEDDGMSEVMSYDSPPGTAPDSKYIKMISLDGTKSYYVRVDSYMK